MAVGMCVARCEGTTLVACVGGGQEHHIDCARYGAVSMTAAPAHAVRRDAREESIWGLSRVTELGR